MHHLLNSVRLLGAALLLVAAFIHAETHYVRVDDDHAQFISGLIMFVALCTTLLIAIGAYGWK